MRILRPISLVLFLLLYTLLGHAQKNLNLDKELSASELLAFYHQNKLYQKAYNLSQKILEEKVSANSTHDFETYHQLVYYHLAAGLALDQPDAVRATDEYLSDPMTPTYYHQRMCLVMGQYYFGKEQYASAMPFLISAGEQNLSPEELNQKHFQLGYSYFLDKNLKEATEQFAYLKDSDNPYRYDASYYYGLITFGQGDYPDAQSAFAQIESHPKYKNIIPYYMAEIYYYNDDLDKCIEYAEKYAQQESIEYKENYHALLAQAYFEKREYSSTIREFELAQEYGYTMMPNQNYTLGYAYYKSNILDSAISLFRPLSDSRDSVGQNAMYLLADCYLQKKDLASASRAFNFCKDLDFNKTIAENSHFNYIKANYATGQYHEALRNIETFDKKYPNSEYHNEKKNIMGTIFLSTNNFEKGWKILAKDSLSEDANTRILIQKIALQNAKSLLNSNKNANAIPFLEYCKAHPELNTIAQEAKLWHSEAYARVGDFENTKRYALDFLANMTLDQRNSQLRRIGRYNLSLAYLKLGQADSCIYYAKQNLMNTDEDPYHITPLSAARMGDAYFMKNDYPRANKYYEQARSQQTDNYYLQYQEAKINGLQNTGNTQTQSLKKIADDKKNPFRLQAHSDLGDIYLDRQDYTRAAEHYQICATENFNKAVSLYKSGLAYEGAGKTDVALAQYTLVINEHPDSDEKALAQQQIKQIYIQQNQTEKLTELLSDQNTSNTSSNPLDSSTYYIAENYFMAGKYPEAIEAFRKYQTEYPGGAFESHSCYYLGTAYVESHQSAEAIQVLEKCQPIANDQYYDNVHLMLADLYLSEKRDTSAATREYSYVATQSSNTLNIADAVTRMLYLDFETEDKSDFQKNYSQLQELRNSTATITDAQMTLHQAQQKILEGNYNGADGYIEDLIRQEINPYTDQAYYLKGYAMLKKNKLKEAEQLMLNCVNLNFITDYWNLRYYLLLSEIFIAENDQFNAKATLNSLIDDSGNAEIKYRAQQILKEIK